MSNIQPPELVNINRVTNVCSDVNCTREFSEEKPESEFAEPPEAN